MQGPKFELSNALRTFEKVKLVFADLSFERPSCYYELGLIQALGIPSILLAECGTTLHQHSGIVHMYKNVAEYERLLVAEACRQKS